MTRWPVPVTHDRETYEFSQSASDLAREERWKAGMIDADNWCRCCGGTGRLSRKEECDRCRGSGLNFHVTKNGKGI